jgi:ATP-dependent helicase/nuclease subunit A
MQGSILFRSKKIDITAASAEFHRFAEFLFLEAHVIDEVQTKKKQLDADQCAVRDADSNLVVTAGAGSGKTTVLAERYVRLVCERNISVDEILTLTFTRKAAAEMYGRIYQRLSESNHPRAAEQLQQFDRARISTLDSFCTLICRGASYRYGIAGNFSMDETELAKIAEDAAIEVIMKHRDDAAIHNLVSSRSFDDAVKAIFADIGIHYISIVGNNDFEKLAEKQIDFLESEINIVWKLIEELCTEIIQIDDSTNNATVTKAKDAARNFPEYQLMNDDVLRKLNAAAAFIRSGKSFTTPRSNVTNAALVELRDYAIPLKENAEKLSKVLESYSFKHEIIQLGIIFNEYAKTFQEAKRQKGILSFADSAELAVMILRDDHELRNYYKKQFKAIMIDEFQDNNQLQKELLYLLAEREDVCNDGIPNAKDLSPDKLFFVGDEKQSIYRFRGADVSVFRGLSIELEKSANKESKTNPVSMALQTNYRSHPELVQFFNMFFAEVFGKAEHLFEAEYHSMIAGQAEKEINDPRIEIYLQEIFSSGKSDDEVADADDDAIDAASSEAIHAASRIIEGVKNEEFSFRDVAILFRSTTHQSSYEKVFRDVGIPFNAADPRGVFAEALVNDFYAMLRLSLFHQDTNAYATVLRSPFARIGDETFVRIMLENPEEPFLENPPEHWFQHESDKVRYAQAQSIFHQLETIIDIKDISEVISFLWYETPYRTDLINNPEIVPLFEHFNYLYNLALDAVKRKLNMASFLDELAPLVGTYSKAESGDPETGKNAVTIMTVHKSKGLEFKVLIIADAGSESRTKTGAYYFSDEFGPVVNMKSIYANRDKSASNYIYEIGKEENQRKSEAELKRLLYVAATRAEERLMIFGSRKINKDLAEQLNELENEERLETLLRIPRTVSSREGECKDSFMDLLYIAADRMHQNNVVPNWKTKNIPLLGMNDENRMIHSLYDLAKTLQTNNQSSHNLMPSFFNLPSTKHEVPKKRIVHPSALEVYDYSAASGKLLPSFSCDKYLVNDELKKSFGTLCHFVIEQLFADEDAETLHHDVMDIFRKENLKPSEIKNIVSSALECGKTFLASDLGVQALSSRRCENEYPFYLPFNRDGHESIMVKGTIDLIFETDDECIIVDYKTDQYMKPEIHQVQMDTYRLAASAFSDLPVKIMLVYLRSIETVLVDPILTEENLFDAMEAMFEEHL